VPRSRQNNGDLSRAVKRLLQIQLVDQPHQGKIGFFYGRRLAMDRRTRQTQQRALPRDGSTLALGFNLF
jgi:hypothetical protein